MSVGWQLAITWQSVRLSMQNNEYLQYLLNGHHKSNWGKIILYDTGFTVYKVQFVGCQILVTLSHLFESKAVF